ncbi:MULTISPECIES: hypothetical protein [Halobacteriovorax]|uniref:PilZ domain-containing protein n=1 Tax=Halobacteriovorax vibrionivorans TaxID=2152716 RepID=A0ABY0IJT6_9BACT|nr:MULTISPECIES: hypothetical protein [Halobacteriovorax]RZF23215.1 hypothetical protein DAY19_05445 [Halobacteriovorax vibrionivorans]TGD46368.1 hypothetical protein EP118_12445 [Halobacteriovorax sp. Y22]
MIHIQVLDSQDLLSIGHYTLNLPRVFIGSSIHNNIPIEDTTLDLYVGVIKHMANSLTFVCAQPFKLNEKRIEGIVKLNKNDIIEVQNLKFKIVDFDENKHNDHEDYYQYLEDIKHKDPKKYKLIQALEQHYIKLTGQYDNDLLDE